MIRKLFFAAFSLLFLLASCRDEQKEKKAAASINKDSIKTTSIQWLDTVKDFGRITDGEIIEVLFRYRNSGNNPLVFFDVKAGCGCTIVEKPEEAILPGKDGVIRARFDSRNKTGDVHKYITAVCNTATANYTLMFQGEVLSKDNNSINKNNNNFPQQPKSF